MIQHGRRLTPTVLLFAGFLLAWGLSVRAFGIPQYIVPAPQDVANSLVDSWGTLMEHSLVTLLEALLGFALAVVIGIPLAILIVFSPRFERTLYPALVASQAVPKIALAPLFIVVLGFGIVPKVLMAFLISFFPVVIDTTVGLRSIRPEMIHLSRSMGAGPVLTFTKVRFPSALPSVLGGLKISISLAVVGAVAAEFVGSDAGLGHLLVVTTGLLDTPLLYAALVLVSVIGIGLFSAVVLAERALIPWHVSHRTGGEHH
ncbi:MAG: ABC transporter permease subunit [Acidimicrobiia bacterium]|nr:ABC transporter permease subunit [Acidimicrobiia bacterium]